jgi:DNA-binding XRE family transcriptional regulator
MFHKTGSGRPLGPYWEAHWAQIRRRLQQRRASREQPPEQETLRQLRKGRGVTQDEMAVRIGTSQGEISKLERRSDLLVSTLEAYVEALGGTLDLTVRFPGLAIRVRLAGSLENRPR